MGWVFAAAMTLRSAEAQELPIESYRLENGLQVILHVDHSLPQIVVDTWYRVGSKDEAPGRSGFAHLFEHLMFMGTDRLPGNGFDREMEAAGGWNNAWTMEDATNYFDVGPPNLLATFLWMEADRMEALGRAMTQEKLDLQREVVRNERRQSNEDRPYGMVEIALVESLYPAGHPYAHSVIGSHEDLVAASVDDVKGFFATWYAPNNASLVVAGDFDPAEAKALVERYFAAIPAATLPPPLEPGSRLPPPVTDVTLVDQVQFPQLNLAWPSAATFGNDDAALELAANLLGEGESSRLYRRLVVGELAQEVSVMHYPLLHGGVFMITAIPMEGHSTAEVQAAVEDELRKLAASPPTAAEMERLQNQHGYQFLAGLEPLQDRAEQINRYAAWAGDPGYLAKDLARFAAVTPEAIRAAVAGWLVDERKVRIVVNPEPAAETP
jgi:predicted Zn-dependent peptidase